MSDNSSLILDTEWLQQQPFNFFGPCSAESLSQMLATAEGLSHFSTSSIFRAGIWKPRTRPNTFEGIGSVGLEWLKAVKEQFGFQTATEVANAKHVELALEAGVDVLWVGARTTVNPFSVQEIAEALRGLDIPVFVKNPIHADLSLWVGALERINQVGITKLGAIHRGFHDGNNSIYRNSPKWQIALELKRMFSNLPIVCDASHISGIPGLIPSVAQKSLDLNMDGLMIETHIHPDQALSDAKQQVTPELLKNIITHLVHPLDSIDNITFTNKLEELRSEIDKIDDQLIELMANRMELVKNIGSYKKENKVTVFQLERWKAILQRTNTMGNPMGLTKEFINGLFNVIHDESIRQQTEVMNLEE